MTNAIIASKCCCTCGVCSTCNTSGGFHCDEHGCWIESTSTHCKDLRFQFNCSGTVVYGFKRVLSGRNCETETWFCGSYPMSNSVHAGLYEVGPNDLAGSCCCSNVGTSCSPSCNGACTYTGYWYGSIDVTIPKTYLDASNCPGGAMACCNPGLGSVSRNDLQINSVSLRPDGLPDVTIGDYWPCASGGPLYGNGIQIWIRPWIGSLTGPMTRDLGFCDDDGNLIDCSPYPICSQLQSWISAPAWANSAVPANSGCIMLVYLPNVSSGGVVGSWRLDSWYVYAPPGDTGGGFGNPIGWYPYRYNTCSPNSIPDDYVWPPPISGTSATDLYQYYYVNVPSSFTVYET